MMIKKRRLLLILVDKKVEWLFRIPMTLLNPYFQKQEIIKCTSFKYLDLLINIKKKKTKKEIQSAKLPYTKMDL